jgi:hypothetical protein
MTVIFGRTRDVSQTGTVCDRSVLIVKIKFTGFGLGHCSPKFCLNSNTERQSTSFVTRACCLLASEIPDKAKPVMSVTHVSCNAKL